MSIQVNNKACAQCEAAFKGKNTKSMNCSICSHWFCLDCSHISTKIYDVLKNEPNVKNLPFNCDGCSRVLPKLTELAKSVNSQQLRIESCEKKVDDLKESLQNTVEKQVEKAITEYKEREDRKCNLIIHNVPEPNPGSLDKKADDENSLKQIFDITKSGEVNMVEFTRLGRPAAGKDRLIKVQLRAVSEKHKILGGTKHLRTKVGEDYAHEYCKVFITPDQTKEERIKSMNLKKELERRKKDEKNDKLIIFRGEIVEKRSIASTVNKSGGTVDPAGTPVPGGSFQA